MKLPHLIVIALLGYGAWHYSSHRPLPQTPGVLAAADPLQTEVSAGKIFPFDNYRITALASFSARARVLSVAEYSTGREADLSPVDLALGWGNMSDSAIIDQLSISQRNRFYHYSWPDQPPLPPDEIIEHSANMHFIPANAEVETQLQNVRTGNLVEFSGYLVRVDAADGWHWVSSLTRRDSGDGACELVWLERLKVQ